MCWETLLTSFTPCYRVWVTSGDMLHCGDSLPVKKTLNFLVFYSKGVCHDWEKRSSVQNNPIFNHSSHSLLYFKEDEMTDIVKINEMAMEFVSKAKADLAKTSTMDEVKGYRERAEALRVFYQHAKKGIEFQNFYAEVRIRAERRGGEILQDMRANNELEGQGGDRKSKSNSRTLKTLDDLGISKNESSRYKKLADIPEEAFEDKIKDTKDKNRELTTALFLGLSNRLSQEQKEKDDIPEIGSLLNITVRRVEKLYELVSDILFKKDELRIHSVWDTDDRRDLNRLLDLLVKMSQDLLKEMDAIEKSKGKIIDVEVVETTSAA